MSRWVEWRPKKKQSCRNATKSIWACRWDEIEVMLNRKNYHSINGELWTFKWNSLCLEYWPLAHNNDSNLTSLRIFSFHATCIPVCLFWRCIYTDKSFTYIWFFDHKFREGEVTRFLHLLKKKILNSASRSYYWAIQIKRNGLNLYENNIFLNHDINKLIRFIHVR